MSFLGFGGPPQPTSAQKLAMAEMEMDIMSEMMNKLSSTCYKKCVPPEYKEGDLNKGESVCLDRCVHKYMEAFNKVGQQLNNKMQAANAAAK
ncbi:Tim10/DDP family zinc finger-domain-containing protein [Kalaharituber pfeilii]|nr:Tim10/DDP family zinc finger-domain-containing protein [Kalaharituber pfeilii]